MPPRMLGEGNVEQTVRVGLKGFYLISGAALFARRFATEGAGTPVEHMTPQPSYPWQLTNQVPQPSPPYTTHSILLKTNTSLPMVLQKGEIKVNPFAVVSLFNESVVAGDTVSLTQCFQDADPVSSRRLADTVESMYTLHGDHLTSGGFTPDQLYSFFNMYVCAGPIMNVLMRKTNA